MEAPKWSTLRNGRLRQWKVLNYHNKTLLRILIAVKGRYDKVTILGAKLLSVFRIE
jgi:hypothetical protein